MSVWIMTKNNNLIYHSCYQLILDDGRGIQGFLCCKRELISLLIINGVIRKKFTLN